MNECIIDRLPATEYHADKKTPTPSLSKSCMHTLLTQTPAHARLFHPRLGGKKKKEADKMDYGSAAHAMLMEGGAGIVVVEADDWRTKAAREAKEAARAEHKFPVLEHQYEKVCNMAGVARAFVKKSILGNIMEDCKFEESLYWQDTHGIWCRGRTDIWSNDRTVIVDYKATEVGNPGAWCRSMSSMGYDLQEAFYRRGARKLTGIDPEFFFLVQEIEEPHACYLVQLSPAKREIAERRMSRGIAKWRECIEQDYWPAYNETIYHAESAAWEIAEEEAAS